MGESLEARSSYEWERQLLSPDAAFWRRMRHTYGADQRVLEDRLALLRAVVFKFCERFGDAPLSVFRCPGRVNLRGMHVDTHGGYLNLMTHQRETVVAASPSADGRVTFANTDARFAESSFAVDEGPFPRPGERWRDFIQRADVRAHVNADRGAWGHYVRGAYLRASQALNGQAKGLSAVVGSDIPHGASLSSSASLCLATLQAVLAWNGGRMTIPETIVAGQDAEWFTGSRCGTSDQAAMVLGARETLINIAIDPAAPEKARALEHAFPRDLRVLVINSNTRRSISGAEALEYTRNRFAYSMALDVARAEMRAQGLAGPLVERAATLPGLSPLALDSAGGVQALYRILRAVPPAVRLEALRERYELPSFERAYEQYFAGVPVEARPRELCLRGPLMFGVAESERARLFPDVLRTAPLRAGALMSIGHDGDRRFHSDGSPHRFDTSDRAIDAMAASSTPMEEVAGAYGASSRALDALVDAAVSAGALGASLTGAGIAGSVLALCGEGRVDRVVTAVRQLLLSDAYRVMANLEAPLSAREADAAIVVNHAVAGLGEITLSEA